jgi:hypothetical protein
MVLGVKVSIETKNSGSDHVDEIEENVEDYVHSQADHDPLPPKVVRELDRKGRGEQVFVRVRPYRRVNEAGRDVRVYGLGRLPIYPSFRLNEACCTTLLIPVAIQSSELPQLRSQLPSFNRRWPCQSFHVLIKSYSWIRKTLRLLRASSAILGKIGYAILLKLSLIPHALCYLLSLHRFIVSPLCINLFSLSDLLIIHFKGMWSNGKAPY